MSDIWVVMVKAWIWEVRIEAWVPVLAQSSANEHRF
jgi:hypothetical protein